MDIGPRKGMKHSYILQECTNIYSYKYSLSATRSTDMYRDVQDQTPSPIGTSYSHPFIYQKADLMAPRAASCLI